MIKGCWKVPWEIMELVEEIQQYIKTYQIHINHIFSEGNEPTDYIANWAIQHIQSTTIHG